MDLAAGMTETGWLWLMTGTAALGGLIAASTAAYVIFADWRDKRRSRKSFWRI